ncbi:hypothetical protein MWU75_02135 [Ornithinimicrobium sp. F0845]|uniref:hypothetical protein n=1 Tax=Ornithinimicrobium sp. F0845 TaxID=2926412 RepID=UPI001FF6F34B|nr:hypothetical protein [Ornithinimicrobium sp. F0845]MCK0110938.1 hypothetical protein [Ornithinimicrobium sp. F0845]
MAGALTLTAEAGNLRPQDVPEEGGALLEVLPGTQITLVLAAAAPAGDEDGTGLADLQWTRGGETWQPPDDAVVVEDGEHRVTLTAEGEVFSTYQATATVGTETAQSNTLEVRERAKAAAPDKATESVAEIAVGEYDSAFAKRGFIALVIAVVTVAVFQLIWISEVTVPDTTATLTDDQQVMGTFAERMVSRVVLIGATTGIILLLVGAYLAALETRGRLRLPGQAPAVRVDGVRGTVSDLLKDTLEPVLKAMQSMRGMMATLVVGGLILGGSLLLASTLVSGAGSGTADTDQATETPTGPSQETGVPTQTPAEPDTATETGR